MNLVFLGHQLWTKATGFPIAKVAALLAVGYTDELRNDITDGIIPSLSLQLIILLQNSRFSFEKFPQNGSIVNNTNEICW